MRNRVQWALTFGSDIPVLRKASEFQRDVVLRAMELGTAIYDPTPATLAIVEPDLSALGIALADYELLDDHLGQLPKQGVAVVELQNEHIVRSRYHYSYQPWAEPKLAELRDRFGLDEVVAGSDTEFDKMIQIRNAGRSRWRRSDWQPRLMNFDSVAFYDRDHRNTEGLENDKSVNYTPCSFFPPQFVQLMLSMGYMARYVSVSHESVEFHGMTEVWSNQHRKWVSMDADLNLYYARNGTPMNLLEVHNLRYDDDPLSFEMVRDAQDSGDDEWKKPLLGKDFFVSYHTYFRTELRNDWFTNYYFRGHPRRSEQATLYFEDPRLDPPRPWSAVSPVTSNIDDFYWTLNQTEIHAKRRSHQLSPGVLALLFRTVTPNFDAFEVIIDDAAPVITTSPELDWPLHEGENTLSVRTINEAGVPGIPSKAVLNVD